MMSILMTQIENQLERLQQLIPPGVDAQEHLRDLLDAQIASLSPQTPMGVVPATLPTPSQALASARVTVEMLEDPEQLAARPEGIILAQPVPIRSTEPQATL
jgi:DNA-directed RNA polymerase specialized sigma54-like protein